MHAGGDREVGDPFVDPATPSPPPPPPPSETDGAVGPDSDSVHCSRDVTLCLGTEGLVSVDEDYTEESPQLCGLLTNKKHILTRSIPYFHILSATSDAVDPSSNPTLTIRYARPSPSCSSSTFRVATLAYPLQQPASSETRSWLSRLLDRAYGPAQRNKRIKVLINPFGGKGSAQKYYTRDVEPILAAAKCDVEVEHTEYSGHAVKIAEELDAERWDVVACCSGDGVPHEVFNGLGRKKDARVALGRVAVVQMPCGSGNAMSLNLNGTDSCSLAALCVVKGVRRSMDLVSVTQGDRRTLSFLSQSVGIVAESDLGTENLRWMGDLRFTYGFLVRLLGKTIYPCDVAVAVEVDGKEAIRRAYHCGVESAPPSPKSNGELLKRPRDEGDGLPPLRYGTVTDPLPEGWELVPHDTLGNFYAGNMAYMAADANFFPAALPSDGCLDLIRIDGRISRRVALVMISAVGEGTLFGMEAVDYKKVSGYRIVPKDQADGYISIDGERVPFEPFQAEVHRGLGTVLMRGDRVGNGGYEASGPK